MTAETILQIVRTTLRAMSDTADLYRMCTDDPEVVELGDALAKFIAEDGDFWSLADVYSKGTDETCGIFFPVEAWTFFEDTYRLSRREACRARPFLVGFLKNPDAPGATLTLDPDDE